MSWVSLVKPAVHEQMLRSPDGSVEIFEHLLRPSALWIDEAASTLVKAGLVPVGTLVLHYCFAVFVTGTVWEKGAALPTTLNLTWFREAKRMLCSKSEKERTEISERNQNLAKISAKASAEKQAKPSVNIVWEFSEADLISQLDRWCVSLRPFLALAIQAGNFRLYNTILQWLSEGIEVRGLEESEFFCISHHLKDQDKEVHQCPLELSRQMRKRKWKPCAKPGCPCATELKNHRRGRGVVTVELTNYHCSTRIFTFPGDTNSSISLLRRQTAETLAQHAFARVVDPFRDFEQHTAISNEIDKGRSAALKRFEILTPKLVCHCQQTGALFLPDVSLEILIAARKQFWIKSISYFAARDFPDQTTGLYVRVIAHFGAKFAPPLLVPADVFRPRVIGSWTQNRLELVLTLGSVVGNQEFKIHQHLRGDFRMTLDELLESWKCEPTEHLKSLKWVRKQFD